MANKTKIDLFRTTDTTLVFIASSQFAKELKGNNYHNQLYIHVTRDTGYFIVYEDNDINKVVPIGMKEQEYILQCAEIHR